MGVGGVLVATSTCNLHKAERTGAAVVVQRERAALRDAVIGILGDAEHAAGLRARALDFARDHLDWQPLGVDMLAFYETLAERRSSCAA